jgi:hypothetical protein
MLVRLEKDFQGSHRKMAEALRTIRRDDLYKEASPPYATFDDYVEGRWGRTRQWAGYEIRWLETCEKLAEITKDKDAVFSFNKDVIARFNELLERAMNPNHRPEQVVMAYFQCINLAEGRNPVKMTAKVVQEVVEVHMDFIAETEPVSEHGWWDGMTYQQLVASFKRWIDKKEQEKEAAGKKAFTDALGDRQPQEATVEPEEVQDEGEDEDEDEEDTSRSGIPAWLMKKVTAIFSKTEAKKHKGVKEVKTIEVARGTTVKVGELTETIGDKPLVIWPK